MISLFDHTHQHILAEAVQSLSLSGGHYQNENDRLLLGSCAFPKGEGFCQHVLGVPSLEALDDDILINGNPLVVLDVKNDETLRQIRVIDPLAEARFYAAVPIISPKGVIIGSYSILDPQPRTEGLGEADCQFLKDMSVTVMDHLDMKRSKHRNRQTSRMVTGLGSFVEGKTTLRDSWQEARKQHRATEVSGQTAEGQLNKQQQDIQEDEEGARIPRQISRHGSPAAPRLPYGSRNRAPLSRRGSNVSSTSQKDSGQLPVRPKDMPQESNNQPLAQFKSGDSPTENNDVHSNAIKGVFSRAANLIRESVEAEGVVFFDANPASFGEFVTDQKRRPSGDESREEASSSEDSHGSSILHRPQLEDQDLTPMCRALGHSTSTKSSINNENEIMNNRQLVMPDPVLKGLLNRYPHGKIFNYHADQSVTDDLSSDGSLSQNRSNAGGPTDNVLRSRIGKPKPRKRRNKSSVKQDAKYLIKVFPNARSIMLLPITDFPRAGSFAASFVWTNNPARIFTSEHELTYISAFGNSIMAEIHRLDFEMAEKAKTNLVSSISHELRNPLHGILGTADILSDTAMNALQHGMVHTIESCGRTLLDTINHMLDFASVKKSKKWPRHDRRGRAESGEKDVPANPKQGLIQPEREDEKQPDHNVKLDAILEEVIESVFAGYCFYTHPRKRPQDLSQSSGDSRSPRTSTLPLGPVTVIFDIQGTRQWSFQTQPGAWRRILMNLLGNALKYTPSGFIYLALSSLPKVGATDFTSDEKSGRKSFDGQMMEFDITLTVKDTGKGIGSKYLQKDLFTPFTQEDGLASGSGLGLSIVRQAVRSLNGSIDVSSAPGKGTEFSIRTTLTHQPIPTQSEDLKAESDFDSLRALTSGKKIGLIGFESEPVTLRDTTMYAALQRLCRDWFGFNVISVPSLQEEAFDFYLVVKTDLDHPNEDTRDLNNVEKHIVESRGCISPIIVLCPSPEHAHNMFASAKGSGKTSIFEFISQPCGPRKLAKALELCTRRQKDQNGQQKEPTRWVELPESSHLPVDISSMDTQDERMTISKRPTIETMQSPDRRSRRSQEDQLSRTEAGGSASSQPTGDNIAKIKTAVLLVDDNELNLQLLIAQAKKEQFNYMTGRNGVEALEAYKSHPNQIGTIVIGTYTNNPFPFLTILTNGNRSLNACHGWHPSITPNSALRKRVCESIGQGVQGLVASGVYRCLNGTGQRGRARCGI